MAVDLRTLLKKYINLVGLEEGVTFIPRGCDELSMGGFTAEELALLHELEAEADADAKDAMKPIETLK